MRDVVELCQPALSASPTPLPLPVTFPLTPRLPSRPPPLPSPPYPPLRPGDVNGSMAALRMAAKQIQNELNGIVKVWTLVWGRALWTILAEWTKKQPAAGGQHVFTRTPHTYHSPCLASPRVRP